MSSKKNTPFNSKSFCKIEERHLYQCIEFLMQEGIEFAVVANLEYIEFNPPLPKSIFEALPKISLFILSGYSFESSRLNDNELIFEAGFGVENFGSVVTIPLLAIEQVVVDNYPIAINIAEPFLEPIISDSKNSMEALLSRAENRDLLKKNRD